LAYQELTAERERAEKAERERDTHQDAMHQMRVVHDNALAELAQARDAIVDLLSAERFSNRPPETVAQAEDKLTRIRAAVAKAEAVLDRKGMDAEARAAKQGEE
jgi:hypothetical protein